MSIPTGMIHDPLSAAMVTALQVAAKFGCAAVEEIEDDFVLLRAEGVCV
jgi:hypothetical protein